MQVLIYAELYVYSLSNENGKWQQKSLIRCFQIISKPNLFTPWPIIMTFYTYVFHNMTKMSPKEQNMNTSTTVHFIKNALKPLLFHIQK